MLQRLRPMAVKPIASRLQTINRRKTPALIGYCSGRLSVVKLDDLWLQHQMEKRICDSVPSRKRASSIASPTTWLGSTSTLKR